MRRAADSVTRSLFVIADEASVFRPGSTPATRRAHMIALVIACAAHVPPVPAAAPVVSIGADGHQVLALQGLAYEWRTRPHRLSHLSFGAALDGPGRGTIAAEVHGGSWASGQVALDEPTFVTDVAYVSSEELVARHGTVHLTVTGSLADRHDGGGGRAVATIEVPATGLPAGASLGVALCGFTLDSGVSHESGYTIHALGVEVGEPVREGDVVRFDVAARVQPAPVPDRRQRLATYGAEVEVDWVLLAVDTGVVTRQILTARLRDDILPGQRVQPSRFPVTWPTAPDTAHAVALLSGFDLDITKDGWVAGRYLRALAAGIEGGRTDGDRFEADVVFRFANNGPAKRRVPTEARASFTLLQLGPDAQVHTDRWTSSGTHQREVVQFPLEAPAP
jgi:hypothetical protein